MGMYAKAIMQGCFEPFEGHRLISSNSFNWDGDYLDETASDYIEQSCPGWFLCVAESSEGFEENLHILTTTKLHQIYWDIADIRHLPCEGEEELREVYKKLNLTPEGDFKLRLACYIG